MLEVDDVEDRLVRIYVFCADVRQQPKAERGIHPNRLRCDTNDHGLTLIRLAANGELLFHMGTWGGAAGYRWCGPDGTEAGIVPPWEDDVLDALAERGMLTIETRLGPLDRRVVPTGPEWTSWTGTHAPHEYGESH